jgi:hypothetical protein
VFDLLYKVTKDGMGGEFVVGVGEAVLLNPLRFGVQQVPKRSERNCTQKISLNLDAAL